MNIATINTNRAATIASLYSDALALLQQLIATPSLSREEQGTAQLLHHFMVRHGMEPEQSGNNIWVRNRHFDTAKPTLLLNSHHDTVKPNAGYTRAPFMPAIEDGKLYGLGSNDAGGCLVALLSAFRYFYAEENLAYNLIFAATAEEEISGADGVSSLLPQLGNIDCAIVGEPTLMDMAMAEKGLLVLDCTTSGTSGHAARNEGVNAIYKALPDIEWFRTFRFPRSSSLLGDCKMSVTVINAGLQHNVVPDTCSFTVDVRVNDCYTHEEIMEIVQQHVSCDVKARSLRLRSTRIDEDHPLVRAGKALGKKCFGSATLSDKALMPFPALKMGPGDSLRSHTADEFIYVSEVEEGIDTYIALLKQLL
jgi:acetylornithine deacetylase